MSTPPGGGVCPGSVPGGGGGGGTFIFSSNVGSDPASTVHPPKKYQEFQAPQKIFEILATQKQGGQSRGLPD